MTQIKSIHLAIQINKNQSPISFQLTMKTIITFCSIWAFFFGKNLFLTICLNLDLVLSATPKGWKIGITLSDHFFDFGLFLSATPNYLKRKDFYSRSKQNPYVVNYW